MTNVLQNVHHSTDKSGWLYRLKPNAMKCNARIVRNVCVSESDSLFIFCSTGVCNIADDWCNNFHKRTVIRSGLLPFLTCCKIGRMNFSGSGENLFCLRKSYKFCSSISNTKHVWFLCWKHSNARTKLNSSAFSWLRRDRMDTSIWPCRAYDGWFFRILIATMSLVPRFQHFTTWPNVPRPKNSSTYYIIFK